MANNYLMTDINEKGGCHFLGWLEDGKIRLEEVHRFDIKYIPKDNERLGDMEYIFEQIKTGIANCKKLGKLPVLVGLTACDGYFVFIDEDNKVIDNMIFNLELPVNPETFKNNYSAYIERAKCFLMLSDYFNFLLTGNMQCNYTNLLAGGLVSRDTLDWNEDYIEKMGFDKSQFPPVSRPGSVIGNLTLENTEEIGYDFIVLQTLSRQAGAAIFKMSESSGTNTQNNIQSTDNQGTGNLQPAGSDDIADELKSVIGCLCILMITGHDLKDLDAAKACIRNTFYAV